MCDNPLKVISYLRRCFAFTKSISRNYCYVSFRKNYVSMKVEKKKKKKKKKKKTALAENSANSFVWMNVVHGFKMQGIMLILCFDSSLNQFYAMIITDVRGMFFNSCHRLNFSLTSICTRAKRLGNYRGVLCDIEITQQF